MDTFDSQSQSLQITVKTGKNIEMNSEDISGWTPFKNACINGQKDVVKYLKKNHIELNGKDLSGWTPFKNAYINGQKDVVKSIKTVKTYFILKTPSR